MFQQPVQASSFRFDIQGTRGVAFLLVFIFHLYPSIFRSGFIGVDVFFVLSGYVITSSLMNTEIKSSLDFFSNFYKKRFLRLFPALSFAIIFTFILLALFISPSPSKDFYEFNLTGLSAIIGLSNIFLQRQALDYFGDITTYNPFLQTWSLSIEFQFYILYPILLLCSSFIKNPKASKWFFIVALLSLTTVSFCGFIDRDIKDSYFSFVYRFWELGSGCLCLFAGLHFKNIIRIFSYRVNLFHYFYIITLCAISFLPPSPYLVIAAVLLTAIILIIPAHNGPLFSKTLTRVGLYSYSLYLFHWPIICFLRWTINPDLFVLPVFTIILLVPISAISFFVFECKVREILISSFNWSKVVFLYIFVFAVSIVPASLRYVGIKTYIGTHQIKDVDELSWSIDSFRTAHNHPNISPRLIVLGNSHARHLLPMFSSFSDQNHYHLFYDEFDTQQSSGEVKLLEHLEALSTLLGKDDVVVISSAFFSESSSIPFKSLQSLVFKWSKTLSTIGTNSSDSPRFVFFMNSPRFVGKMPYFPLCYKESFRPTPPNCILSQLNSDYSHDPITSMITKYSSSNSNLLFLNVSEIYCSYSVDCTNYLDSTLLMRDSSHFTHEGALLFYDYFNSLVKG